MRSKYVIPGHSVHRSSEILTILDRCHIRQGPAGKEQRKEHILEHHAHPSPICEYPNG